MGDERDRTPPIDTTEVVDGARADRLLGPSEDAGGDPPCWEGLVEDHRDRPPPREATG